MQRVTLMKMNFKKCVEFNCNALNSFAVKRGLGFTGHLIQTVDHLF